MKLRDLEVLVVGNPPPGFGGRYFIFVKLTTDDGIVGWGEVYAATVGPEAMRAVIADVFARHMAGESPENIELMFRRVYSAGFSQRPDPTVMGAFSGLEIACWDILGKARDRPVHALWGGRMRERLRSYTYLYPGPGEDPAGFYNDPDASAACAARMVEAGFTAVKFDPAGPYTIHGGHQPTLADLDRSEAFCGGCARRSGDRADLLFGTHGQFTPSGAIRLARRIAPYDPLWFEEPVPPDLPLDLARVAAASPVPIAAGERLTTKAEFATLLRAGGRRRSCSRASGGSAGCSRRARSRCWPRGSARRWRRISTPGRSPGRRRSSSALTIPNFLILETIGTGGGFHAELLTRPIVWEAGYVLPPDGPGLGVEIDEAVARAHPWTGERLHLEMSAASRPTRRGGGRRSRAAEAESAAYRRRPISRRPAARRAEISSQARLIAARRALARLTVSRGRPRAIILSGWFARTSSRQRARAVARSASRGTPSTCQGSPRAAVEVARLDAGEGLGRDAEDRGRRGRGTPPRPRGSGRRRARCGTGPRGCPRAPAAGRGTCGRCARRRPRSRRRPGGRG